MGNGNGVSRGDRNRNARLGRLRALVAVSNAIVGSSRTFIDRCSQKRGRETSAIRQQRALPAAERKSSAHSSGFHRARIS
jgi:hypothetical protein